MKRLREIFHKETIKFEPALHLGSHNWGLQQRLLAKLDQIDEKKISNLDIAQEVFLLKNRKELSRKADKRLVPKVLEDVSYILEKGWCREISKDDLYHVHLCKDSPEPIFSIDTLLSNEKTRLLYHGSERSSFIPYFLNRNIKSSLVSEPEVIPFDYQEYVDNSGWKTYQFQKITYYTSDLGWSEYGKIKFERDPDGPYKLKDRTRLSMLGSVHAHLLAEYLKLRRRMLKNKK